MCCGKCGTPNRRLGISKINKCNECRTSATAAPPKTPNSSNSQKDLLALVERRRLQQAARLWALRQERL